MVVPLAAQPPNQTMPAEAAAQTRRTIQQQVLRTAARPTLQVQPATRQPRQNLRTQPMPPTTKPTVARHRHHHGSSLSIQPMCVLVPWPLGPHVLCKTYPATAQVTIDANTIDQILNQNDHMVQEWRDIIGGACTLRVLRMVAVVRVTCRWVVQARRFSVHKKSCRNACRRYSGSCPSQSSSLRTSSTTSRTQPSGNGELVGARISVCMLRLSAGRSRSFNACAIPQGRGGVFVAKPQRAGELKAHRAPCKVTNQGTAVFSAVASFKGGGNSHLGESSKC